ncbi:Phospholipid scramblase [Paragonimus heterotremus]|uniref:Phospholipid scramblase n=1 Tax=Paragonimus heterotremus TaxID=100268 RepID=A0A8J4SNG7_9TREM|nr:Phospholipid scramblase [Paragonimus heterotremus]
MHVEDNSGTEVIRVNRPYKYRCCGHCCSCSECCLDELEVEAPAGHTVGYVKQVYRGCDAYYKIKDAEGTVVLQIRGPSYCRCTCYGEDINFNVLSADGKLEVGRITKQWTNFIQEYFTDADNFGISFPMDLDVKIKATLIGAVFLIDFMFFETSQRRRTYYGGGAAVF